jgi:uncharacterized protein YjbI with pentapeptide repeats
MVNRRNLRPRRSQRVNYRFRFRGRASKRLCAGRAHLVAVASHGHDHRGGGSVETYRVARRGFGARVGGSTRAAGATIGSDCHDGGTTATIKYGAQLQNCDLHGVSLRGAALFYANLDGADLDGADLTGAQPELANLTGATLVEATLDGANVVEANLTDADISEASLRGTDAIKVDLTGANLTGATLNGANLDTATLTRATFAKATLEQTYLGFTDSDAFLDFTNHADFTGADLTGANLKGADFTEAKPHAHQGASQRNP